jgi:hypothetical protein
MENFGNSRFGKPSKKLVDNIKTDVRHTDCEVDGSGIQWRAFAISGVGLSGSIRVTFRRVTVGVHRWQAWLCNAPACSWLSSAWV